MSNETAAALELGDLLTLREEAYLLGTIIPKLRAQIKYLHEEDSIYPGTIMEYVASASGLSMPHFQEQLHNMAGEYVYMNEAMAVKRLFRTKQ